MAALDGSGFSLKLGFKDNPTTGDDFLNLNSETFTGRGILLKRDKFIPGPIETDPNWGPVQTLTLTVRIQGDTKDDAIGLLRTLNRFIQRSNFYFQDSGGNVSSRGDGRWHDGEAAVLTYQPADATNTSFFDVIEGTPAPLTDLVTLSTKVIEEVTFTLKIRAGSRLARVKLNNLVAMGDAAPPFSTSSSAYGGVFLAGWVFTGTWTISENSATFPTPKFGARFIYFSGANATATTNEASDIKTGDIIVPDIYYAISSGSNAPTGTLTAKLQIYNGTVWTDQQNLVNLSSIVGTTNPQYVRATGTPYTVAAGITKVRILVTGPTVTGSTVAFDGFAMWKNPVGSAAPLTEYASGGKTAGIPAFNVYGLRGDVKVPIKMRFDNPSASQIERFFIVSGMSQDLGTTTNRVEYPIFGLDLTGVQTGTTAANLPWGTLPGDNNGTSNPVATSNYALDSAISRTLDRRQRLYRAYLVYAANNTALITAVKLSVSLGSSVNAETKTFNVALPQTYATNTVPTAAQYGIYDLGDFLFSRPGVAWENNTGSAVSASTFVTLTHANDTTRHTSIAGVILLPQKVGSQMAATLDIGTGALAIFPLAVEIYNEGKAPRGAIQPSPLSASGDIPVELSSYDATGSLKGGNLWVLPAEASTSTMGMRFEVLMLRDRSATTKLFTFDARDAKQVSIEYTPRYLHGMAS